MIDTQFFVSCAGMLSAPLTDQFPGAESLAGRLVYTSSYPADGPELAGKRVGVVGVGATGIQVIQTIADQVGHLTVFARTPQYVLPTFTGFEYDFEYVPGKSRQLLSYIGGVGTYRQKCEDEAAAGYPTFQIT